MNEFLTYYNINWKKHLHLFNIYDNVQGIFIIPPNETNNCLNIGNLKMYDITFSKIKKLDKLGPFITIKKYTKNFNTNIEEGMVNFFEDHKYYKWIGIVDDSIDKDLYIENTFKKYIKTQINIAYIIPFRNREETLTGTVNGLKKYIEYQNLEADIWVIEQNKFGNWNKGMTCNCGFDILKSYYQYFIFNDADTYPELPTSENDKINFIYPSNNQINHIYGYEYCLGGVFSCDKNTFIKINGFNNNFFNWGREDRDLEDRCQENGITINRNNLIKLTNKQMNQLKHDNKYNYWNFKENENDINFFKSRELYYFNQIEHSKKNYNNGLSNLKNMNIGDRKIILIINLKKWTKGIISVLGEKSDNIISVLGEKSDKVFEIITLPNSDTGLLRVNYDNTSLEMPINPEEKYPKIQIEITNEKYNNCCIKYNYLFDKKFTIINTKDNYRINYNNIELDFDNIYTPFDSENDNGYIKYSYYPTYTKNYYFIKINF